MNLTDATEKVLGPTSVEAAKLSETSLDDLWAMREEAADEARSAAGRRGYIDMELQRRVNEANPAYDQFSSGSVELAGERYLVRMGWSKEYDVVQAHLITIQEEKLLTAPEFAELVSYTPKINGTTFNQLVKRGGRLAEVLQNARPLKGARATFEGRERKT